MTVGKGTDLAYCLEHSNGMFKITDMKYRDDKFDVCIMTNTIDRRLSASFTESSLFCSSLERKVKCIPIHTEDSLPDDDRALHFWQAGDLWQYRGRDVSLQIQIFWQCPVHSKDWTAVFYYLRLILIHQEKSFRLRTWLLELGAKQFPSSWEESKKLEYQDSKSLCDFSVCYDMWRSRDDHLRVLHTQLWIHHNVQNVLW